ncbi:MAG: DUF3012 domain-containing protein [Hyphomicrobiales bacterium]|nr:DUF3012 domain-containing protein [Hyphomicrobiales bacterium]MCP5371827.1 DUF3012 domain-containing protein [Hyphomicrobiales bacterium]
MVKKMVTGLALVSALGLAASLGACSPEVGSEAWCKDIKEKGVTNVTAQEAADYAKHCVVK